MEIINGFYIPPAKNFKLVQRPPDFSIDKNHQLAKDLVFAGLGKFPGTNQYTDSSGYGNNGTLTAMAPLTDWARLPQLGRWGLGLRGASATRVIMRADNRSNIATPLSFSIWAKYAGAAYVGPFGQSDNGGYTGWGIWSNVVFVGSYNSTAAAFPANFSYDTWHHLCCVYNKINVTAYCDGIAGTPVARTATYSVSNGILLGTTFYGAYYATGTVADACVWNRALSIAEIQQLADPSNTMLSGLVVPSRRKMWAVSTGSSVVTYALPYTVHP